MSPAPTVSVIIVNWNGRQWLEQCLPTVMAQTYREFEVIVVDNGSGDGSADWLARVWPAARLIQLARNEGFARANNAGIGAAGGHLLVLLNNDTLVEPGWLEALVEGAAGADIGMVASCIAEWKKPTILDSAGVEVDWAGFAWNRYAGMPVLAAAVSADVFGPGGAAALYKREMLDDVGLFDEDFFAYYEDVDLAWRAQRAGWRCRYVPEARVLHWQSATGGQMPHHKRYLLSRNRLWTVLKNTDWPAWLWAWPLIFVYDCLSLVYHTGRMRSLAPLRGRLSALRGLPSMLAKRAPGRQKVKLGPPPPFSRVSFSVAAVAKNTDGWLAPEKPHG